MPGEMTFPEFVETERLVLRCYSGADAPGILELVHKNRDRLVQNFAPMAKGLSKVEEARSFADDRVEQWKARKAFCYGIWRRASVRQIGQLQIKNVVWDVPAAELSYFIDGASQLQGFASEAISAIVRIAFQEVGFQRISVRVIPSNKESTALAKKLGFRHEGRHRSEFRCGLGELHDVNYYSLTMEDFRNGLVNVGTTSMDVASKVDARLAGVELYFDDLPAAKRFYSFIIGLTLSGEQPGHHAQFDVGPAFLCLEKKGVEDYPSRDKAVVFLEVPSVAAAVETIGRERIVRQAEVKSGTPAWAVLHDSEGHNVLLLERVGNKK